jgi:hypothetical protein
MRKISICLIGLLLLALLITGCSNTPAQSPDIPTFEELLEINELENIFKTHTNAYIVFHSKSVMAPRDFTGEVIYIKDEAGFSTHKRIKGIFDDGPLYVSDIGTAYYYLTPYAVEAALCIGSDPYYDQTLDFDSIPVGKGYMENDQIVYHSYRIAEADEMLDASRTDITLYFNKDTKHIERMDYVIYNAEHKAEVEYSLTVSYDVENVQDKLDTTAYDTVMGSDKLIDLEIIVNAGAPEQASYPFVAPTDALVWAEFDDEVYLLYTDAACQNEVATLDAYSGRERVTLYAKPAE